MSKLKYNKSTLSTLEEMFAEMGYMVRYEKGNFKSGYCILKSKRLIVVNKYFPTDGRISCLADLMHFLLPQLDTGLLQREEHLALLPVIESHQPATAAEPSAE
ncbi:hypothetical protein [Eisenibacter elegans]|jgi:hypothetical protein|uniref:hypothetical protein n=1 Tax=Eisenibacter elegans TaxID=997 RepID=UPI0012B5FB6D|nr:hypothetical protein [Eisenibacter elegans]